jgi:hypothetical protein
MIVMKIIQAGPIGIGIPDHGIFGTFPVAL